MTTELLKVLLLSFAVAAASFTIAKGVIFQPLRTWLRNTWIGKLVGCWYCTSHYVSALAVLLFRPDPFSWGWPGLVAVWLAIVACSALIITRFE